MQQLSEWALPLSADAARVTADRLNSFGGGDSAGSAFAPHAGWGRVRPWIFTMSSAVLVISAAAVSQASPRPRNKMEKYAERSGERTQAAPRRAPESQLAPAPGAVLSIAPPGTPKMDTILVKIVADDGGHLTVHIHEALVRAPRGDPRTPLLLECTTPCIVRMLPGRYRIYVPATASTMRGWRDVDIFAMSKVVVAPKSQLQTVLGLTAGVVGALAFLFGTIDGLGHAAAQGLYGSREQTARRSNDCDARCARDIGLMIGGGIVSPIGWVMFAKSLRPTVEVEPFWHYPMSTSAAKPYPALTLVGRF